MSSDDLLCPSNSPNSQNDIKQSSKSSRLRSWNQQMFGVCGCLKSDSNNCLIIKDYVHPLFLPGSSARIFTVKVQCGDLGLGRGKHLCLEAWQLAWKSTTLRALSPWKGHMRWRTYLPQVCASWTWGCGWPCRHRVHGGPREDRTWVFQS